MARGALDALGRRVSGGLVVTKDGHSAPVPPLEVLEASHPIPDARSVEAAERALRLAQSLGPSDALLVLISGGASALWCAPARDVRLEEKQLVTQALLNAGAEIREINTVRKHLSRIKGGRLLAAAQPAKVLTLAVSDVAGDAPDQIGSGPTFPDPTTSAEALAVLRNRGVEVSPAVRRHLESGAARERDDPGSVSSEGSEFLVVAGLGDALEAARAHAKSRGQQVRLLGPTLYGEARALARSLARRGLLRAPLRSARGVFEKRAAAS
jgi:hydroxypyruvate reductase